MANIVRFMILVASCFANTNVSTEVQNYKEMSTLSRYDSTRCNVRHVRMLSDCEPINIWSFHRHGARSPGRKELNKISSLLKLKQLIIEFWSNETSVLSATDLERLRDWNSVESVKSSLKSLLKVGYNEITGIAKRFKERFPTLYKNNGNSSMESLFYFAHSNQSRTIATAHAYMYELFGDNLLVTGTEEFLIKPKHRICKEKINVAERLKGIYRQLFNTNIYKEILHRTSKRLGLSFDDDLTHDSLTSLFLACGFDSANYQDINEYGAWCPVLGDDGRKITEYLFDVSYESKYGYTYGVRNRVGCEPIKDLWERFEAAVGDSNAKFNSSKKSEKVVAYFSHDAIFLTIHSVLGLLKDDPALKPDNYQVQMKRRWRTSKVSPFAANIAFVLHKCRDKFRRTEFKVMILENERPCNDISNCPNGVCTWNNFRNFIKPVADNCNFKEC